MLEKIARFFASSTGIIVAGAVIGLGAIALQQLGNPPNMGLCAACFQRDIAGALGLHRASPVQYIRPEIIGFVLGAMLTAFVFREFRPRAGSAPIVRFVLGAFATLGALVFLGCPWRAMLRLAGGDLNAVVGIAGLAAGIGAGVFFLKRGYSLGRASRTYAGAGLIIPIAMLGLLALLIVKPQFGEGGPVFFSQKGPGSLHAPLLAALGIGLAVGFLAQRTRFCTMGALRDVMLMGDTHLLRGVLALVVAACAANLAFGKVAFGFEGQPIAHASHVWNFLGMTLSGLAFTLGGGCPGRQLFLSGEGDGDAGVFVLGMLTGAAFSHNFALAGKADAVVDGVVQAGGLAAPGGVAVILGLVVCVAIGATMREK